MQAGAKDLELGCFETSGGLDHGTGWLGQGRRVHGSVALWGTVVYFDRAHHSAPRLSSTEGHDMNVFE